MVRGARPSVTAGGPPLPECAGSLPGPCLDRERPGPRAAPGIAGEDAECAGQRGGRQAAKFSPGRGRWALLLLQLHLLRALAQGRRGPGPGVGSGEMGASRGPGRRPGGGLRRSGAASGCSAANFASAGARCPLPPEPPGQDCGARGAR